MHNRYLIKLFEIHDIMTKKIGGDGSDRSSSVSSLTEETYDVNAGANSDPDVSTLTNPYFNSHARASVSPLAFQPMTQPGVTPRGYAPNPFSQTFMNILPRSFNGMNNPSLTTPIPVLKDIPMNTSTNLPQIVPIKINIPAIDNGIGMNDGGGFIFFSVENTGTNKPVTQIRDIHETSVHRINSTSTVDDILYDICLKLFTYVNISTEITNKEKDPHFLDPRYHI